jgi:hypothetical protein
MQMHCAALRCTFVLSRIALVRRPHPVPTACLARPLPRLSQWDNVTILKNAIRLSMPCQQLDSSDGIPPIRPLSFRPPRSRGTRLFLRGFRLLLRRYADARAHILWPMVMAQTWVSTTITIKCIDTDARCGLHHSSAARHHVTARWVLAMDAWWITSRTRCGQRGSQLQRVEHVSLTGQP